MTGFAPPLWLSPANRLYPRLILLGFSALRASYTLYGFGCLMVFGGFHTQEAYNRVCAVKALRGFAPERPFTAFMALIAYLPIILAVELYRPFAHPALNEDAVPD